jgi:hypothetical protein
LGRKASLPTAILIKMAKKAGLKKDNASFDDT